MDRPTTLESLLDQPFSPHIPEHQSDRHTDAPSPEEMAGEPLSESAHSTPATVEAVAPENDEELTERLNEAVDELLLKEYLELHYLIYELLLWAAEKLPDDPEKRRKLTAFSVFTSALSTIIFYKLTGKAVTIDTELISGLIGALRTVLMSFADDMVTSHMKSVAEKKLDHIEVEKEKAEDHTS